AVFYYNGAMDTLKQFIDGGVIHIPSGQREYGQTGISGWTTEQAMKRMRNILKACYGNGESLDIALCANDSTALGVTQAIAAAYTGKRKPLITGQDGDEENLKNIIDGKQAMTVYKSLKNEVKVTLELGKKLISGEEPGADFCDVVKGQCEVKYDTESYENGVFKVPSYLLIPEVVTRENYKEVLVDTGEYTIEDSGYLKVAE
ncbi:MAG: substrate-binding domain-containing protein, partial [Lachnospiraceae bacterium]|nr:substrate-binding domain-containing protein [Lachnospiraceae bacterium]